MENDIKQVLEILSDIQEHMASKDDLSGLERSLRSEISENTQAIAALSEGLSRSGRICQGNRSYYEPVKIGRASSWS